MFLPALLICGEKDKAGSAKSYNKKWHQREGLPLKWIKNAGHNSNTDQPDEVNRMIEKFIRGVEYDAIAIPGGDYLYGFFEKAYDERFLQLICEFDKQRKIIASVCVAALPIGKAGVLEGRKEFKNTPPVLNVH